MSLEGLERYDRHIRLDKVGIEGQNKINKARVLVIGAGGLGCPVLQYLTAAGVGHIGIVDNDVVSISNLQRQVLYGLDDIAKPKAIVAKKRLESLNNLINIEAFNVLFNNQIALELIEQYDIIVDCTDNFSTRYMLNDACVLLNKPLVYGAIHTFEGQVSVFNHKNGPHYRSLFPTPPLPNSTPNCSEVGVLGVLPGVIGCYQANEVLKIILEIGEVLSGQLFIMNLLTNKTYTLKISKGDTIYPMPNTKEEFKSMNYPAFCGVLEKIDDIDEIEFKTVEERLKDDHVVLIDVRESHEQPKFDNDKVLYIPLSEFKERFTEIPKDKDVFIFCHLGVRSLNAVRFLKTKGQYKILKSIIGGIEAMI